MKIFSNFISNDDSIYDKLKLLNKPITFFYDYIPKSIDELNINPYNFIMLSEPDEFFGMHTWVKNNSHLFTGILTWNEDLIKTCDNAILFHHSGNFLDSEYINLFQNVNKKFEISFLSGAKNLVEGHKLRQEIYKIKDQIKIPKKWFYVLDDFNWDDFNNGGVGRPSIVKNIDGKRVILHIERKKFLYNNAMFYVSVENVKHNNWYTEKISESFLTKTVPLYWGCPNISNFGYDERGIIRFNTPQELLDIINNLTPDVYNNMKPYIDYNYEVAKNEVNMDEKLYNFFDELTKMNNI